MTTVEPQAAAAPAPAPVAPKGRLSALAPHARWLRIAGGVLAVVGALLPWATFVLNEGPYPDKATLQFFVDPFGVSGYRMHTAVLGLAAVVVSLIPGIPAKNRIVRALGWGIIAVGVINGCYI